MNRIVTTIVIALLIAGCSQGGPPGGGGPGGGGPPPVPVKMTTLIKEDTARQVALVGEVEAERRGVVRSQVEGVVQEVLVREGERVGPSTVLVQLEDADQRIALAQARARLTEAESSLLRLTRGTRAEVLAQRRAELRAAEARRREAAADLKSTKSLTPSLLNQRKAEVYAARAREKDAQDNLDRVKTLVEQGALADRDLVTAQAAYDEAYGDRLRAEHALAAERTQTEQSLLSAEAGLEAAGGELSRVEATLAEAAEGPRPEEIEAQRGVVQATLAAVEAAQLNLDRTAVRAGMSGTVVERSVSVGDRVQVNDPVATVVGGSSVEVFLEVPEELSGRVAEGQTVTLHARALPEWEEKTTVTSVVPAADPQSRRQTIRVQLDDPPPGLLPGMAVEAELSVPPRGDYLVVSRDALVRQQGQWVIFTVEEGKARPVQVTLNADLGPDVAVSGEVSEGMPVVLRGAEGLREGSTVIDVDQVRKQ